MINGCVQHFNKLQWSEGKKKKSQNFVSEKAVVLSDIDTQVRNVTDFKLSQSPWFIVLTDVRMV